MSKMNRTEEKELQDMREFVEHLKSGDRKKRKEAVEMLEEAGIWEKNRKGEWQLTDAYCNK